MSLKIVEDACRNEGDRLVIVVEGANPGQLLDNAAKTLALKQAAALGYPRVGINTTSGPYPVDADGRQYEDMNEQARNGLIAAYRNDVYLMSGL